MLTSLISIKSRNTRKRWKKMRCANTKFHIMHIYIMEGSLLFIHFIVAQTVLGKMDKYTQIVHTALYPLRHPSHPSHTEILIPMRWRQSIKPRALPSRRSRERALLWAASLFHHQSIIIHNLFWYIMYEKHFLVYSKIGLYGTDLYECLSAAIRIIYVRG